CETFSVHNFVITGLRILFSTLASTFFILLYYFIALKKKQNQ
ncbi:MAG TPA: rod shape-determining protein MreD, partial [Odoribacter splanchnicus]|nr:rod shape-determining protein MreD [Odoribacter splanchnicus]